MIIDHNHIENASVMANIYHHWKNDRFSFSPYIGAGAGLTKMKMFDKPSIKHAYQLKAGLDYRVTKDTNLHIGYRYFAVIGANLELEAKDYGVISGTGQSRPLISPSGKTEKINIGNKLFSTHGVEVGLTTHFANGA